jgi:hypothetical protein
VSDAAALQAQMAAFLRRRRDLAHDDEARRFAEAHLTGNARLSPVERLEVYREQFYLRHTSSLLEDFPGVSGILGQDDWDKLVWDYLATEPPVSYDLAELGAGLADFAATRNWLTPRDLVVDMARLEYAHLAVFAAPDSPPLDPAKLGAVPEDAWERARLVPDTGLRLLEFRYPVVALRRTLVSQREDSDERPVALPEPKLEYRAIHRRNLAVFHDELAPDAFRLLARLAQGEPLGAACENAAKDSGLTVETLGAKLETWFSSWAACGYVVDVVVNA